MTPAVSIDERTPLRWRRTPVLAAGLAGAGLLAAVGLAFSRPDLVGMGLPLALATAWTLLRRPRGGELAISLTARGSEGDDVVSGAVSIATDADWVQLAVDQAERRTGVADVAEGESIVRSRGVLRHSGPSELLAVTARAVAHDGAWIAEQAPMVRLMWNAVPKTRPVGQLPTAPRLSGLYGVHEGSRAGHGGDFRDIHPFAPGDELRRVDWRATARLARRPGELLVRRTNALSEASVVIAMDTADDLGEVVASWGAPASDHSGVTSLDLAREASLSMATTAIGTGDRVAFHQLSLGGRSVRAGAGVRHLARLRDVISATGAIGDIGTQYRRTPPIPVGSMVFVISTFFDGAAARLATQWRAAGHAVVAVDVLPHADTTRLSRAQKLATRTLLAERADILAELRHAGIDVVSWSDGDVDAGMRLAATRRERVVRR